MKPVVRVLIAFLATYGAGLVGYLFVDAQLTTWFASLNKPALMPPNEVFGIVWMILYAMMALSFALIWLHKPQNAETEGWIRFYLIQLLFNAAWTMFFFGLHSILIAFIDILFLIFIVFVMIAGAFEMDKRAGYLLVPYLAWLIFAAYLNMAVWLLN